MSSIMIVSKNNCIDAMDNFIKDLNQGKTIEGIGKILVIKEQNEDGTVPHYHTLVEVTQDVKERMKWLRRFFKITYLDNFKVESSSFKMSAWDGKLNYLCKGKFGKKSTLETLVDVIYMRGYNKEQITACHEKWHNSRANEFVQRKDFLQYIQEHLLDLVDDATDSIGNSIKVCESKVRLDWIAQIYTLKAYEMLYKINISTVGNDIHYLNMHVFGDTDTLYQKILTKI